MRAYGFNSRERPSPSCAGWIWRSSRARRLPSWALPGSGKTTLATLVPRLIDPTGGRITLDGRDIRDLTLESLRSVIGFAFEEATLFSMSVRENLTLGRPDATDDEVDEALAIAQADFVRDLPWGLTTRVGEQGLSLSGGQRQRLALARAVLGKPRLLVLDDPLSALDVHTESLVEEALARVLAGTTAILVVHRPSTVALADRVALLQDGVIAAVGHAFAPAGHRARLPRRAFRSIRRIDPRVNDGCPRMSIDVDQWRGVAEDADAERTAAEAADKKATIRLRASSRRLLGNLMRAAQAARWPWRSGCCCCRTRPPWPGRTWSCSASAKASSR